MKPSSSQFETLARFHQFLAALARLRPASIDSHREQLTTFLAQAGPLVVNPTRIKWRALQPQLAMLRCWFTDCDLLDRIIKLEDSYTDLISWALRPATDPSTAELRQRAWLTSLGIDSGNVGPVEPCTQVPTEDGIPDLVLSFATQTVVVEVKTESAEHLVPSGKFQTVAYPEAVRSKLSLSSQHLMHMVFLTPDGRGAANRNAKTTSFGHFALVLARALVQVPLADEVRLAFAMLITRLATLSFPSIRQAVRWEQEQSDDLLLRRFADISQMAKLLVEESNV